MTVTDAFTTGSGSRPRALLGAAFACVVAFVLLLGAAYWTAAGRFADGAALDGFRAVDHGRIDGAARVLASLADPVAFLILVAGVLWLALALGRPRHAAAAALLLGGANLTTHLLKPLLAHPRGGGFDVHMSAAAFPSGHATAAMSLALALVLVTPRELRRPAALVGGGYALAVSISLLVAGWHYPTDVVGGFLVATAWCLGALAALRASQRRWPVPGHARGRLRAAFAPLRARHHARAVWALSLGAAALAGALVLPRLDHLAVFASEHTFSVAAGCGVAGAAALLLDAVTLRRRARQT